MNFLQKIKYYFYQKKIEEALKKDVIRRTFSLERSKNIGILFDANDSANLASILNYAEKLERKGKRVSLLGYLNTKEIIQDTPYPYFNNKQIGFNHLPSGKNVSEFTQEPFDLLINFFLKENLSLEYISTNSKARCRVGNLSEKIHCFDLIIPSGNRAKDFVFFARQIEAILSKMNRKKVYEPATV